MSGRIKIMSWPGVVDHVCNLSFSGGGDWKESIKTSLGKKLASSYFSKEDGHGGLCL
jgi:hypothetical protein